MTEFDLIIPLESGGAEPKPIGFTLLRVLNLAVGMLIIFSLLDDTDGLSVGLAALFFLLDIYAVRSLNNQAQGQLLAFYAEIKEPIFEWQQSADDSEVFNRAEAHRDLLKESENALYKLGKIEVVEMYWKDPTFDYCETFDEFETRRADIKRDYLREWAKKISKGDDVWRKQFLHGQRIVVKESKINGSEVLTK